MRKIKNVISDLIYRFKKWDRYGLLMTWALVIYAICLIHFSMFIYEKALEYDERLLALQNQINHYSYLLEDGLEE